MRVSAASTLRRICLRHPEWWVVALSLTAWISLWLTAMSWVHEHSEPLGAMVVEWLLMPMAMIGALAPGSVRSTAERSLWRRRHRAIAGFVAGYQMQWLCAGAPLLVVVLLLDVARSHSALLVGAAGFTLATVWQCTPIKRRAVSACHGKASLAPTGWRADADCVRYGRTIGSTCVQTCWPMMLAAWLAGHAFVAMIAVTAMAAFERYSPRLGPKTVGIVLGGLAASYALLGLYSMGT